MAGQLVSCTTTTKRTRAVMSQVNGTALKTKLLIIDDRETVRQALEARLSHAPEIELVGSTGSSEQGVQAALELKPDIVLLEIKMADGKGLDTCRQITQTNPSTAVIILTSYVDEDERQAAFQAGASSYVLKDIDSQRLISAIETLCHRRNRP
jgi:DNA-binding NarL/FixJ family response regulator